MQSQPLAQEMAVDWSPNNHGNNHNNHNNEHAYSSHALPSPTETPPYNKRNASMSRPSTQQRRESSPGPSPASSPFSPDQGNAEDRGDMADAGDNNGDSISPLDPRRFTPTLHASLVSEILSLRRELEGKSKEIDTLEVNLDNAKSESEEVQDNSAQTAKENRSLKRQLKLLEGGSLSAVNELAKERDEAQDTIADLRKRLEQTQKKLRTQEEQTDRSQEQWDNERQRWDDERRNLERKVHVVEGRLKVVLNEVAAAQAANSGSFHAQDTAVAADAKHSDVDDTPNRSSSILGRRRTSTASSGYQEAGELRNNRISVISMPNGRASRAEGGVSLADELAFDEEEENDDDVYYDDRSESRATFSRDRPFSAQSFAAGTKARKSRGLPSGDIDRSETPETQHALRESVNLADESKTISQHVPPSAFEYTDTGIQYTPPPSPPLVAVRDNDAPSDTSVTQTDSGAAAAGSKQDYQAVDKAVNTDPVNMISNSSQTTREPSPPATPDKEDAPSLLSVATKAVQTATTATQTEEEKGDEEQMQEEVIPAEETSISSPHIPIPAIAIHPPSSNPPSPRTSVVLPPRTKNASCQTDEVDPGPRVNVKSSSVQTEEIRLDKRPMRLASSLLPSAIQDQPSTTRDDPESEFPIPIPPYCPPPPRSPKRRPPPPPVEPVHEEDQPQQRHSNDDDYQQQPQPQQQPQQQLQQQQKQPPPPPLPAAAETELQRNTATLQAYPGNNDNGPVGGDDTPNIRRPFRSSSLFAGFDQSSDDEQQPQAKERADPFSDEELSHRPMASYTLRYGKVVSKASAPATILDEPEAEAEESPMPPLPNPSKPRLQRSPARAKTNTKRPPRLKDTDIRRAAMISSSSAAHQSTRPRSPSAPDLGSPNNKGQPPPFPVPIRLSSRKVPISSSDGAQSPTPYGDGDFPDDYLHKSVGKGKEPLRKVRSDVAVTRMNRAQQMRSYSPPTISTESSAAADSSHWSRTPPLPVDDITAPGMKRTGQKPVHRAAPGPSPVDASHSREDSTATAVQQTSVVDAIAQTMIGEWMWKYVRRRRSFGMSDSSRDQWDAGKTTEEVSANISGSGTRHQRWVWLAPYERSIMWSNKQPTSGSALMGKTGRKLVIQSVLDVKDDSPLPKGAEPQNQFSRSILILTPQRALKFTALTVDRHFVWLTALSFLSHSTMDINDLATLPPVPQEEDAQRAPAPPALRRNPIRDSIRVAKGKKSSNRQFTAQTPAVPEIPGDAMYANQPVPDAADPPTVPRFSSHTRKRSNTAPRVPPSGHRSFSHNAAPAPSTYSTTTAGSSDLYSPTSVGPPGVQSGQSSISHRTSEASGPFRSGPTPNFFDAVGTVRMEAFVDRTEGSRPPGVHRTRQRRKRMPNHWPQSPDTDFPRSEDGSSGFQEDPFRGF